MRGSIKRHGSPFGDGPDRKPTHVPGKGIPDPVAVPDETFCARFRSRFPEPDAGLDRPVIRSAPESVGIVASTAKPIDRGRAVASHGRANLSCRRTGKVGAEDLQAGHGRPSSAGDAECPGHSTGKVPSSGGGLKVVRCVASVCVKHSRAVRTLFPSPSVRKWGSGDFARCRSIEARSSHG